MGFENFQMPKPKVENEPKPVSFEDRFKTRDYEEVWISTKKVNGNFETMVDIDGKEIVIPYGSELSQKSDSSDIAESIHGLARDWIKQYGTGRMDQLERIIRNEINKY